MLNKLGLRIQPDGSGVVREPVARPAIASPPLFNAFRALAARTVHGYFGTKELEDGTSTLRNLWMSAWNETRVHLLTQTALLSEQRRHLRRSNLHAARMRLADKRGGTRVYSRSARFQTGEPYYAGSGDMKVLLRSVMGLAIKPDGDVFD
jgi:hypothetical protein